MSGRNVVLVLEDPGAVNFIAPLYELLKTHKFSVTVLASGLSENLLTVRKIPYSKLQKDFCADEILGRLDPAVVIGGTSENAANPFFELVASARRVSIPTIGIVDMQVNAELRFKGNGDSSLAFAPDYLFVPDKQTKKVFLELFYPEDNIEIVGYPQFDLVRRMQRQLVSEHPVLSRRVDEAYKIVFVSEPKSTLNPTLTSKNDEYLFKGRGRSVFKTHIVLEELLDSIEEIGINADVTVRLHPKNRKSEFDNYSEEIADLSDEPNPFNVLWDSDLVVGMTSMLLQEASWLGRKTLSVLCEPLDKERLPAIECGLIRSVASRNELRQALKDLDANQWTAVDPEMFFKEGAVSNMLVAIETIISPSIEKVCQPGSKNS